MRKHLPLMAALLLAGACTTKTVEVPAPVTSPAPVAVTVAATPRAALDLFLASVRAQDIQKMSEAWGDKAGPVRDSKTISREEMEKREIYLMQCFKHDRYRVLGESPSTDGERVFQVELTRGTVTKVTDFFTARGPERWHVRSANLEPVKELCASK